MRLSDSESRGGLGDVAGPAARNSPTTESSYGARGKPQWGGSASESALKKGVDSSQIESEEGRCPWSGRALSTARAC